MVVLYPLKILHESIVTFVVENTLFFDCQACLSSEFSRQEHWSGLPCPPPGALPDQGIKPGSPALQANSIPSE